MWFLIIFFRSCSDDGSSINELTFNDAVCAEQTGSYPSKTNTCLLNADGEG